MDNRTMLVELPTLTDSRADLGGAAPLLALRQDFARLGAEFHSATPPEGLPRPRLRLFSADAAQLLGLAPPADDAARERWAQAFSGNVAAADGSAICTVYAGHQFGNWAGQLGDGRAHLLGEAAARDPRQALGHAWWEVQLKGAGATPYSRHADGRAVLRSSIREFLASEAMWHLGVPTTRALCLVDSDLPVRRERLETAAVVTRLSPSFLRFGHFEHFSHSGRHDALRRLVDYAVQRLYPACADAANPALALLREVVARTAALIAGWQALGFVHGVMNTDNMSIVGWTVDYGPFGFVDAFDPAYTPNTSDTWQRYAWARQPAVARWNLLALASALVPLVDDRQALADSVEDFGEAFGAQMRRRMHDKLGLGPEQPGDAELVQDWLDLLRACGADWTLAHRLLAQVVAHPELAPPADFAGQFRRWPQRLEDWLARLRQRLQPSTAQQREQRLRDMLRSNPCYVPRHHLLQQAIEHAQQGDFAPAQRLHSVWCRPYDEQADAADLAAPPPPDAAAAVLSCSS